MKKILLFISLFTISIAANAQVNINTNLIAFEQPWGSSDIEIYFIDTANFSSIHSTSIDISSNAQVTVHGAFWSNTDEKLYFIMDSAGYIGQRHMYELNLFDNSFNKVLNIGTGEYWADVTITDDDRLFGITSNNSNVLSSRSFAEIDRTTGAVSNLFNLSISGVSSYQKSAMTYNSDDGNLYVFVCGYSPIDTTVMFKIDPVSLVTDTFAISQNFESMSAAHYLGNNEILLNTWDTDSFHILNTNTGIVSEAYNSPDYFNGISYFNILGNEDKFCSNEELTISSLSSTGSFSWSQDGNPLLDTTNSINVNTAGNYELSLTTDSYIFTQSIDVSTLNVPNVSIGPNDTLICDDSSVTLTGSNGGTSQWFLDGVAIAGADSNVYEASVAGLYNMIKTNTNGCSDSASVGLRVTVENCEPNNIEQLGYNVINVYPNPVKSNLNIVLEDVDFASVVKIYDIIGNEVSSIILENETIATVNVEDLNTGLYFIIVEGKNLSYRANFYKE